MQKVEILGNHGIGNTNQSRVVQLKKWFFTFNNYKSEDIPKLETKFKEICTKYVFQEEIGKEGTPHLQGAIWLKYKMRYTEFNLTKKIHWEKIRNEEAALEYCQKSETSLPNSSPYKYGFPPPKPAIRTITVLRPWQQNIEQILFGEPDGRSVHWFYEGIGGIGKSAFCKYMMVKHSQKVLVIQGGKLADIINIIFNNDMDNCRMIIIDIPRINRNKVSYAAIECMLNGAITNTKYETGVKLFNPVHIIIFSNYPPEDREALSADRWKVTNLEIN